MKKNHYKKVLQLSMMSLCLSLLPQISHAHSKKHDHHGHSHHDHGHEKHGQSLAAHVHGEANLSIAIDGQIVAVEYNGPAETMLGFEHAPSTSEEKKLFEAAKSKWEKELLSLIAISNCQVEQSKFNLNTTDGHADIEAEAALKCKTAPVSIEVKMVESYPRIKKLKLDILTSSGQPKTETITEKTKTIKL